jgi:hypothetical protein
LQPFEHCQALADSPGSNSFSPPMTARRAKIFYGGGNGDREPALLLHEADPPRLHLRLPEAPSRGNHRPRTL